MAQQDDLPEAPPAGPAENPLIAGQFWTRSIALTVRAWFIGTPCMVAPVRRPRRGEPNASLTLHPHYFNKFCLSRALVGVMVIVLTSTSNAEETPGTSPLSPEGDMRTFSAYLSTFRVDQIPIAWQFPMQRCLEREATLQDDDCFKPRDLVLVFEDEKKVQGMMDFAFSIAKPTIIAGTSFEGYRILTVPDEKRLTKSLVSLGFTKPIATSSAKNFFRRMATPRIRAILIAVSAASSSVALIRLTEADPDVIADDLPQGGGKQISVDLSSVKLRENGTLELTVKPEEKKKKWGFSLTLWIASGVAVLSLAVFFVLRKRGLLR